LGTTKGCYGRAGRGLGVRPYPYHGLPPHPGLRNRLAQLPGLESLCACVKRRSGPGALSARLTVQYLAQVLTTSPWPEMSPSRTSLRPYGDRRAHAVISRRSAPRVSALAWRPLSEWTVLAAICLHIFHEQRFALSDALGMDPQGLAFHALCMTSRASLTLAHLFLMCARLENLFCIFASVARHDASVSAPADASVAHALSFNVCADSKRQVRPVGRSRPKVAEAASQAQPARVPAQGAI